MEELQENYDYLADYEITEEPKIIRYTENGKEKIYEYFSLKPELEDGEEEGRPVIYATGFASNGAMIPGIMGSFPEVAKKELLVPNEVMGVPYEKYLNENGINEEQIKKYEPEHLKKAVALLMVLDDAGKTEKVDIFAHSEGAIHALIAANLFPDRFSKIVINSTVGLADKKTHWEFLRGILIKGVKSKAMDILDNIISEKPKNNKRIEPISYNKSNNKIFSELKEKNFDVIKMLWSSLKLMLNINIKPYIEKAIDNGIDIKIVHPEFDYWFPLDKIKENLGKKLFEELVVVVKGKGHNGIIREPIPFVENVVEKFFVEKKDENLDKKLDKNETIIPDESNLEEGIIQPPNNEEQVIELIEKIKEGLDEKTLTEEIEEKVPFLKNKAPESLKQEGGGPVFILDGGGPGGGAAMAGELYAYLENGGELPKAILGSSIGSLMVLYLQDKAKDLEELKEGATDDEKEIYENKLRKLLMEGLKDLFDGSLFKKDLKIVGYLGKSKEDPKESTTSKFFTFPVVGRAIDIFDKNKSKPKHFDIGMAITHNPTYEVGDSFSEENLSYMVYNDDISSDVFDASTAHKGTLGKKINGVTFNDGDYGDYIGKISEDFGKKQDVLYFTSYKKKYSYSFDKLEKESKKFRIINPNSDGSIFEEKDRFNYFKLKSIFNKSLDSAREKYKQKSRN